MRVVPLLLALLSVALVVVTTVVLLEDGPDAEGPGQGPRLGAGDPSPAAPPALEGPRAAASPAAPGPAAPEAVEQLVARAPSGTFGVLPPDAGRTATLEGTVLVAGQPAAARLTIVAGPDAGASWSSGEDGRHRREGLYPGRCLVRVEAAGAVVREVLLRHRKVARLDVAFQDPVWVEGRVVDPSGDGIPGARVTLDGDETTSDPRGAFGLPRRAAGEALLVVRAPGWVPFARRLRDGDGEPGGRPLDLALERGASLELALGAADDAEVLVWIVPTSAVRLAGVPPQDAYPWHELNPLRMRPGETRLLRDLPPAKVEVLALHPSARGRSSAWLAVPSERDGDGPVPRLQLGLSPLPTLTVTVLQDGAPMPDASVRAARADRLAATLAAFGELGEGQLLRQPLVLAPDADRVVRSGADGTAVFGLDPALDGALFVTVVAPDGSLTITRPLSSGTPGRDAPELTVDLADPRGG